MRAIDPTTCELSDLASPQPGPDEVLIKVAAAGVNRADLLQRAGHYPPPPGASEILGLEVSGVVVATNADCGSLAVGDEVVALLAGGGYAEYVAVPAGQCLPLPRHLSLTEGAALPEKLATAYLNLVEIAHLKARQTVLIHGGSGGVGSTAIQLAREIGARIITTAGSADKCERTRALGADVAIDYHDDDVADQILEASDGAGVNVVLDLLGAGGLDLNTRVAAPDARIVLIGLQQGTRGELNVGRLLTKRLSLFGSTLRGLASERKSEIVSGMAIAAEKITPQIEEVVPIAEVERAHALLDADATFGSIVLDLEA
ncbi:MAG: NAD(P)H-quinone oxidoreductase [Bowdeniella nasicola]|nr:NAD(P)H-quinone oxidoreductase [Bowdeniella nasicola]